MCNFLIFLWDRTFTVSEVCHFCSLLHFRRHCSKHFFARDFQFCDWVSSNEWLGSMYRTELFLEYILLKFFICRSGSSTSKSSDGSFVSVNWRYLRRSIWYFSCQPKPDIAYICSLLKNNLGKHRILPWIAKILFKKVFTMTKATYYSLFVQRIIY